jgi:zinc ribbon protein
MSYSSCGHSNPERAKFCLECGAALAPRGNSVGVRVNTLALHFISCSQGSTRIPRARILEPMNWTRFHRRLPLADGPT